METKKEYTIEEISFNAWFHRRKPKIEYGGFKNYSKFKSISLPVNWKIKVVRGKVDYVGRRVRISFLQVVDRFSGDLTIRNTVSAKVGFHPTSGNRGKIVFLLKSPIFSKSKDCQIVLVSDKETYTF